MVVCSDAAMPQPSTRPALYKGYRFPPEIIVLAVLLAVAGGIIAGMFGGWRAARLRPAEALSKVG